MYSSATARRPRRVPQKSRPTAITVHISPPPDLAPMYSRPTVLHYWSSPEACRVPDRRRSPTNSDHRPTALGNLPAVRATRNPDQRRSPHRCKLKEETKAEESNVWSLHHLPYCCLHASQSLLLQMSGISRPQLSNGQLSDRSNCSIGSILCTVTTSSALLMSTCFSVTSTKDVKGGSSSAFQRASDRPFIARFAQFFAYISYPRRSQQLLHHLHRARPTCQLTLDCDFYSRYVGRGYTGSFPTGITALELLDPVPTSLSLPSTFPASSNSGAGEMQQAFRTRSGAESPGRTLRVPLAPAGGYPGERTRTSGGKLLGIYRTINTMNK